MKSLLVKAMVIGGVILGLLIPLHMVKSVIKERQDRRDRVIESLGSIWGKPQILKGIYLYNDKKIIYPESISVSGKIETDIRRKGIFKIPFYKADLIITGTFVPGYSKIPLCIDATDAGKIKVKQLEWGGKQTSLKNSSQSSLYQSFGLPAVEMGGAVHFKINLTIKGLDTLQFLPLAKTTSISLLSTWSDPNFYGSILPDERVINNDGFSVKWIIKTNSVSGSDVSAAFGVGLFMANNVYTQTDRSIKYGILFITLTFLAFFIFELINTIRIHPFQYSMVGLSLVLFYLLLLSFSEHIHFYVAYLISSSATIAVISTYSGCILKKRGTAFIMASLLTILYAFLFVLLQLEEYALLLGSVSLFGILSVLMFITRRIDWYELQEKINK